MIRTFRNLAPLFCVVAGTACSGGATSGVPGHQTPAAHLQVTTDGPLSLTLAGCGGAHSFAKTPVRRIVR